MRKVFFTDVKMVSDLSAVFSIVKLVLNLDSFYRRYFLQGSDGNFQMHQKKNAEILVLELNVEFLIFVNSLLWKTFMCRVTRFVNGIYVPKMVFFGFLQISQMVIFLTDFVVKL